MTAFVEQLRVQLPVARSTYRLPARAGLVVVDAVNGFCTPGAGPLAPIAPDAMIDAMVFEIERLSRAFLDAGRPVFAFRDTHEPDRPEPPYPLHCIRGSGQELLVPPLAFLEDTPGATVIEKDVINAFIGAIRADGSNALVEWIVGADLEAIVVVGICTDICDLDLVVTLLSARNHYVDGRPMLGALRDVVVYEPGCSTYDLPQTAVEVAGLPETTIHPQGATHHLGLYVMQARGAIIAERLEDRT
ncbi:isochorismatase family protein [Methylopila sp. M107]|uniref:isochorismatase family protein n=1 Tax=Methylopila sp. M107 TaxID=1101190 RepID=UPI000377FBF9|nr:isochorismatase family protein [Methylopila sp. M107]